MYVVDTKKLETAILYLQRMTEGNNPVNNIPEDDGSVIKNPNVVRCMEFIRSVLVELKQNDGYIGRRPLKNRDNTKEEFPLDCLVEFKYQEDKNITKFVEQLNGYIDTTKYKRVVYTSIRKWLMEQGYLEERIDENLGKRVTVASDKGKKIGIESRRIEKENGRIYIQNVYGKQAQELLVDNLGKIINND